jgi:hypothetical protein
MPGMHWNFLITGSKENRDSRRGFFELNWAGF